MWDSLEQPQQQQPQPRLGVVTIHDACPAFSKKIFESADELERLNIKFNIALIPFFNEKEDLPRFPEFVDKLKSYKNCQIVLHGLYHELKNGQFDNFHETTEEYLLLFPEQQQEFKEIKLPKVLNWDSTGYPEKNVVNIGRDETAFKLQIEKRPQIIRIALHPRDPEEAIKDQKQMISILKDSAYEIPTYTELILRLEELAPPSTWLD